jgi:hypothetical protein
LQQSAADASAEQVVLRARLKLSTQACSSRGAVPLLLLLVGGVTWRPQVS